MSTADIITDAAGSDGAAPQPTTTAREDVETSWERGAHIEAVDLLLEQDKIESLRQYPLDDSQAARVAEYLLAVASVTSSKVSRLSILRTVFSLFVSHGDFPNALYLAVDLHDWELVKRLFLLCSPLLPTLPEEMKFNVSNVPLGWSDQTTLKMHEEWSSPEEQERERCYRRVMRLQLGHILGCLRVSGVQAEDLVSSAEPNASDVVEQLNCALKNLKAFQYYKLLGKELDVLEARTYNDVFKWDSEGTSKDNPTTHRHLGRHGENTEQKATVGALTDAFVNCGFSTDTHKPGENPQWIARAKKYGLMSSAASLGLLYLWNMELGLNKIDKFQYSNDPFLKAGSLLAFGIVSSQNQDNCDAAMTLLSEFVQGDTPLNRIAAIQGIGYAYAGTCRDDIAEMLIPILLDFETIGGTEVSAAAALALGFVFCGNRSNTAVIEALTQTLIERFMVRGLNSVESLNFCIATALVFLGAQEECEPVLVALEAVNHPVGELARTMVEATAYVGTGDMIRVQKFVQQCTKKISEMEETPEEKPEKTPVSDATKAAEPAAGDATIGSVQPDTLRSPSSMDADAPLPQPAFVRIQEAPTYGTSSTGGSSMDAALPGGLLQLPGGAHGERSSVASSASGSSYTSSGSSSSISTSQRSSVASRLDAVDSTEADLLLDFEEASIGAAIMGISLVALRDSAASGMLMRLFSHIIQIDSLIVRRAVPLAIAISSVSYPSPSVIDVLSRLSHDADADVALNSIIALGIVGAGTNNSRVSDALKQLACLYAPEKQAMFLIRQSQGLLFMGKGLLTLSPVHWLRRHISIPNLSGTLAFLFTALMTKSTLTLTSRHHLSIFHLVTSIRPRGLLTLMEDGQHQAATVRVGQGVDTAGLAGKPRPVTGFQTQNTPVLLSDDERAQWACHSYHPFTNVLEGIVMVRKLDEAEVKEAQKSLD